MATLLAQSVKYLVLWQETGDGMATDQNPCRLGDWLGFSFLGIPKDLLCESQHEIRDKVLD